MKELGKALVGPTNIFDDKVIKTNHQAYKSSEKFKKTWKYKYRKLVQKEERRGTRTKKCDQESRKVYDISN